MCFDNFSILSWALLKAQAIGIMMAWVTKDRKVKKNKTNSIQ